MKKFRYLLLSACLLPAVCCIAQVDSAYHRRDTGAVYHAADSTVDTLPKLAIFVPLYLDSAFDAGGNYRYDKDFPKFLNPGLEFYEGAQLALDSLLKVGIKLEVNIYDTKSASQSISQVLQSPGFQNTSLILGQVSPGEMQQLAAAALQLHIPFINTNFPNDGGITNNPEFVILNSTLKTHCEGIYRFVQRNYPTKPIYLFRKKGVQEDRLQRYFDDIGKNTNSVPLKIRYITLDDNFDASGLAQYLDSTTQTICIAGSLDDNFADRLSKSLASLNKTYTSVIIGMPTWDNLDFTRPEYAGEEIVYTTPFYTNPADNLVKALQLYFKTRFYSRPSDMVFRGYETTFRFGRLLAAAGKSLNGSLGEKKYKLFNDFDIQPVFLNHQTMTLDYFENKKLYFIKKTDGNITGVY